MPAYKSATVNVKVERGQGAQIIFQVTKGPCFIVFSQASVHKGVACTSVFFSKPRVRSQMSIIEFRKKHVIQF